MPDWNKTDIINQLATIHGYRSYLEICSETTGNRYAFVERDRFALCERLMYRCPDRFDDGLAIDYRTLGSTIDGCLAEIARRSRRYDLILVDPYHDYESSIRDIEAALALLTPGGTIIIHDCTPPNELCAHPTFITGEWCGVTYKAFLDIVTRRRDLAYCTVDADYGCGIVRLAVPRRGWADLCRRLFPGAAEASAPALIAQWRTFASDHGAAFAYFQENAAALLKLVDFEAFIAGERSGRPLPRPAFER